MSTTASNKKGDECIKVVVRVRPMSDQEQRNGFSIATKADPERGLISLSPPKAIGNEPPREFYFDAVFGPHTEQRQIYDTCAASVIEAVLSGYNGTIFAYGQTGSGKTHTMEGSAEARNQRGIIPNAFQHIFESIAAATNRSQQYLVRASYLEIYNEEIHDLLSKTPKHPLKLKEDLEAGVYVKDLTSCVVKNVSELEYVMQRGKPNRSEGKTDMNEHSSRSHSIFTIVVECADAGEHVRVGKLNLVDLAGSERASKTGATGERLREGNKINFSLTVLGSVINALVDGKPHVPYRESNLTRLLQNSLGGNAKTVMCANCGPADYNYDETLSTLRYANRAKNIKNKPKINEDPKDAMLREYQDQIRALKEQLAASQRGVMIDDSGKEIPIHNAKKEIIEKIVEREVIKEVKVGISEEEMDRLRKKAQEEKEMLMKQAQNDMKVLIAQQSRTAQERAELQQALDREAEDRKKVEDQQKALQDRLKSMEEKLIKGNEVVSKAAQQEARLKKAERELQERHSREVALARELAEKEEANLQLEDHYTSLQDEVEIKTKKLKKLWSKYQAALQEAKDTQTEYQNERLDFVETIRQMSRAMELKDLIIQSFIPPSVSSQIENRAFYDDDQEHWVIPKLELSGNSLRADISRPISSNRSRRPESDFSQHRRQYDANPRFRADNVISLELDAPDKTTQSFSGPKMQSQVENILLMNIFDGDDRIVEDSSLPAAYKMYPTSESHRHDERSVRPIPSRAEHQSRPRSAPRRQPDNPREVRAEVMHK